VTSRFNAFIPFILKHETAYQKGHWGDDRYVKTERDPQDPGGTTRYGIDLGEHQHAPWNLTDAMVDKLTKERAIEIYWRHWQLDGVEKLPAVVGECYFNCATMSGRGQADLILHRTIGAANFMKDEIRVFKLIVENNPSSKKYVDGWTNRIVDEARFFGISLTT
jgi:lysozyme family protein